MVVSTTAAATVSRKIFASEAAETFGGRARAYIRRMKCAGLEVLGLGVKGLGQRVLLLEA